MQPFKVAAQFSSFWENYADKILAQPLFYHKIIINRFFLFLRLLDEKNSTLKIRELYQ